MPIGPGSELGPYKILCALGAGGMGEVYKATDSRLDRTVAIKVLPEHLSKDPDLRERFEREARAVSSLNHPHICTLHDVGRHEGVDFLVMEYLEGETLDTRLRRGSLPIGDALELGVQIADALDKAHREGVVHRDLKPGNIMLTQSGVKLLDFGLAKTREDPIAPSDSETPTQHKPLTSAGTILGTVQYMAPEQLEGKEVDARADLFAFGAVLHEMLTGSKAFEGESQASLISAIMSTDPPLVSEMQPLSPKELDRIIRKCLAKNPDARYFTAHDLADDLKWVDPNRRLEAASRTGRSKRALYRVVGVGLIVVPLALFLRRSEPERHHSYHLSVDLPADVELLQQGLPLAVSPDGSTLVFGARRDGVAQLWRRDLTTFEVRPIPGTEDARVAFFSPDGEWLAFFANGMMRKLHLERGAVQAVTPVPGTLTVSASWGHDGYIYFGTDIRAGLARVQEDGGAVEHLTTPDSVRNEMGHGSPTLLPDGKHVLFTVLSGSGGRAAILSLDTGTWTRLDTLGALRQVHYVASGHLVYVREESGEMLVVAFDRRRLVPIGDASVVEPGILVRGTSESYYRVSEQGTLAFVPASGQQERALVWLDSRGEVTRSLARRTTHPNVSVDGRVAADGQSSENLDIWIYDERGTERRLTAGGTNDFPVWSPDGRFVVFTATGGDRPRLTLMRGDGVGAAQVLWQFDDVVRPTSWSSDGRFIALEAQSEETGRDVWILRVEPSPDGRGFRATEEPERVHATAFTEGGAAFSPRANLLAYVSSETGRTEIYVENFPERDQKAVVSTGGGVEPVWSPNENVLFFRRDATLFRSRIATVPRLTAGPTEPVLTSLSPASNTHAHYDTLADGGFVMRWEPQPLDSHRIHIVTNLTDRIRTVTSEE